MKTFGVKDFREGMTTLMSETLANIEEAKGKPLQDSAVKLVRARVVFESVENFVKVLQSRAEKYSDQPLVYKHLQMVLLRCVIAFELLDFQSKEVYHIVAEIRELMKRLQTPLSEEMSSIVSGENTVAGPVGSSFMVLESFLD